MKNALEWNAYDKPRSAMYWNYNADDKHSCAMYWKGIVPEFVRCNKPLLAWIEGKMEK